VVTASRMRPCTPAAEIGNDTLFENGSTRLATQYVLTARSWISESRFGWNRNTLDRSRELWFKESPTRGPQSNQFRYQTLDETGWIAGRALATP